MVKLLLAIVSIPVRTLVLFVLVFVSGCSTIHSKKIKTDCNTSYVESQNFYVSKHFENDSCHLDDAANFAIYAILSNNVYPKNNNQPHFNLKNSHVSWLDTYEDESTGLAYEVWQNTSGKEIIVVFRGSEDYKDWRYGNVSDRQYDLAKTEFDKQITYFKDNKDYREYTFTATGHSLGGGLAISMSYNFPEIKAIGFNPSPRRGGKNKAEETLDCDTLFPCLCKVKDSNSFRLIITESGDPLRNLGNLILFWRWQWLAGQDYAKNFRNYNFLPPFSLENHDIYNLARGMLLVGSIKNKDLLSILKNTNECTTYL